MRKDAKKRNVMKAGGAMLLASTFALTGCGGGSSNAGEEGSTAGAESGSECKESQTLQLGYIMAQNDPGDLGAKKFKEIVEEQTDGAVEIALQGSSLLGGEQELWEGMEIGSVDMALTGVGPISFFTPEYAGVQMYYAIRDTEHLDQVYNGEIGDEISAALLEAKGGRVLDWWHRGPRHVTSNEPIRTPEDLEGLKIRTPEGHTYLEAWKALGASPTPMALGELFTALEQGVVEAQENPLGLIATNSFNEVQDYVNLTAHQYAPYILAISDLTWDGLCGQYQQVIQEASVEAGTYEKQVVAGAQEDYLAELQDRGMTAVEDVDVEAFREIMLETAKELEAEGLWQEGLYQRILDVK